MKDLSLSQVAESISMDFPDESAIYCRAGEGACRKICQSTRVERCYYAAEGIDWDVVTEEEIPKILAENIEWIHSAYWLEETTEMNIEELKSLAKILKLRLQESELTVNQVTIALDDERNLEIGTSLYLFKHLVVRKEIVMDILNVKISSCPSAKTIQRIIH